MFISKKDTPQPIQPSNPVSIESLLNRLYVYVEGLTSQKRRVQGVVWLIIAAVFITAASLPLPSFLTWLVPVVGVPGGIILFMLGLCLVRVTRLQSWTIFTVKDWATPRKRITYVTVGVIIAVSLIIFVSRYLPTGIGGVLVVMLALTAYNTLRRTPYELDLAAKGILDPREYVDEEEEAYVEDDFDPNVEYRGTLSSQEQILDDEDNEDGNTSASQRRF